MSYYWCASIFIGKCPFIFLKKVFKKELSFVDKKPFLEKPFGGSEYPWNNRHMGTETAYCEICGTNCESDGPDAETLTIDVFLGHQMVERCCGGLLDVIYEESGEEFAIRFLKEFSKNPFDPRFATFLIVMDDALSAVDKKLVEMQKQIKGNQKTIDSLVDTKH